MQGPLSRFACNEQRAKRTPTLETAMGGTYLDFLPYMAHIPPPLDDLPLLQPEQPRARALHNTIRIPISHEENASKAHITNELYALLEVLEVRFQRRERRLQLFPIPIPKPHNPARNCQQSIQVSLGQDAETHLVPRPDELLAVLARRAADAEEGRAERPGRLQRRLDLLLHRVVWVRRHLTSPIRMLWASNGDSQS